MGKIYAAKINHMTNPMGFLMERTVFSWKVKDCRGKEQKWARIVVAEDASFERKRSAIPERRIWTAGLQGSA